MSGTIQDMSQLDITLKFMIEGAPSKIYSDLKRKIVVSVWPNNYSECSQASPVEGVAQYLLHTHTHTHRTLALFLIFSSILGLYRISGSLFGLVFFLITTCLTPTYLIFYIYTLNNQWVVYSKREAT
jgi:hypothetical protein